MPNSKQLSVKSEKVLPARETLVANSVVNFDAWPGGQVKANLTLKKEEEAEDTKAALLNGKTLEQPSATTPGVEEKVLPKDSPPEQPSGGAQVEEDMATQEDEPLPSPGTAGGEEQQLEDVLEGMEEEMLLEATMPPKEEEQGGEKEPQQEGKMEANGSIHQTGPPPGNASAKSNCVDSEGGTEHPDPSRGISENADPSQAISGAPTATGTGATEVNDSLASPDEDPGTPRLMLREMFNEASDDEDDDDGEETPKALSPTYQDPLASLPVSDVRLPVTLLQLLEDSIEC